MHGQSVFRSQHEAHPVLDLSGGSTYNGGESFSDGEI